MTKAGLFFWAALAVAWFPVAVRGLWFHMPESGSKCVTEYLQSNVVVIGDYYAFFGEDYEANNTAFPSVGVKVTSPFGEMLYEQHKVYHGQFSFTTTVTGSYSACFTIEEDTGGKTMQVGIDWKTGIAAKDWDSVAKKEHIEGMELELHKLGQYVDLIHNKLFSMIQREEEMRAMSDKTNARVARYSEMSIGLCTVISIAQVLYLKRYFRKKKLIF